MTNTWVISGFVSLMISIGCRLYLKNPNRKVDLFWLFYERFNQYEDSSKMFSMQILSYSCFITSLISIILNAIVWLNSSFITDIIEMVSMFMIFYILYYRLYIKNVA